MPGPSSLDRHCSYVLNIAMVEAVIVAFVWALRPELTGRALVGFGIMLFPFAWIIGIRIHWFFTE